ncbi:hypothetical protein BDU57DRAFT_519081 [Ampelomyces quisqualis]|uniref:Zn(2)-C6 fungal-type domain-containing protein n=1 Tax=Ampelomyces quisqualis TaxID=50730 RepID=A0A6A5QF99_AMPQU|nr:hypothetical protein BDU57DRAFT_519081 [Ampelomyces quisqualis]
MPPSAMALPGQTMQVFWGNDHDLSSDSTSAISPSRGFHFSPPSSTTGSFNGSTPPVKTPPTSETSRKDSQHSIKSGQKDANSIQARASVAVACVPCRSRHLKCDGGVRCSRCRTDNVECIYIKSRRGWKGKRKNKDESGGPVTLSGNTGPEASSNGHLSSPEFPYTVELPTMNQLSSPTSGLGPHPVAPPPAQLNLNGTARLNRFGRLGPETAFQSFYHNFYNSHPFCLPEPRLLALFKDRQAPLLEYAVQFLGSSFIPSMPTDMYKEALDRNINNGNYPRDAFSVQALMLFAIGLHAHNEVPRAAQVFNVAQTLTLEIGLHRMEFALMHGGGDPQIEESWRRTWWSMYTVNGMMTAVNPGVQFKLKDIATDVPLPCENDQYFSGHIPYPNSLQDYDDSAFLPTLPIFSSFTYLIDAIRILGKVFECARLESTFEYHAVDVVDQYLCNWRLHLPPSKLDIVNDGHVDEVLFQAHMVNAGSTIMLHRPRSNLGFGRVEGVNICVQPGQVLLPTQTREIHTAKCLTSAENISSLIRLPGQLLYHTPFFTCVVVMASVVHLSYWSFLVPDGQDDIIKQSIRLDVGTLQQYSNTWPIANIVLGQVRGVAHTLFSSKKAMSIHLWSNIDQHDIIRNVIEEGGQVPMQQYAQLIAPMLKS